MDTKIDNVMTNDELKKSLLKILIDVTRYCDENDLKYVLSSGTLLGAVRHKGFIPWDDDIDIYMPREDFEKLHKLVNANPISNNYQLESLYNGNSAYPFAKVVDLHTEIVNSHSKYMRNLWIDIFPVDGVTEKMAQNANKINAKLFRKYMLLSRSANELRLLKSSREKIIAIASKILGSPTFHGKQIEKYSKRYKMRECPYAANIAWGGIKGFIDSELYFKDRVKLEFEGEEFYAPKMYDEYLTKMYGNYMKLPPENQRDTHDIIVRRIK